MNEHSNTNYKQIDYLSIKEQSLYSYTCPLCSEDMKNDSARSSRC